MYLNRLLLFLLAAVLLLPGLVELWLFHSGHWLAPFLVWALLILLAGAAAWRHRHHEL